jgi:hypothetical protein
MSRAGLYETRTALAVVSGHINHQGRGPHRPPQPRQARLKARHRPTLRPPPAITPAWAASCLLARVRRWRPAEADDIPTSRPASRASFSSRSSGSARRPTSTFATATGSMIEAAAGMRAARRFRIATGSRFARSYQPDFAALATHETINEIPLKSKRVTDWALLAEGLARDPDTNARSSEPPSRPGVDRSGIQPSLDSYTPLDQLSPRMASGDEGCCPDRRGRAAVLWRFVLHAGLAARSCPSRPARSRAGSLSPQSRAAPPFEQAR